MAIPNSTQNLPNILDFVKRYWKGIIASTIVGLIFGYLVGTIGVPGYRGVMALQVGRVGVVDMIIPDKAEHQGGINVIQGVEYYGLEPGYRMLMTAEELYRTVTILYDHRRARRNQLEPPYISELNNYEGSILEVVVRAESKEQAEEFLADIKGAVIAEHEEIFEDTVGPLLQLKEKLRTWHNSLLESSSNKQNPVSYRQGEVEVRNVISVTKLLYKVERALTLPNTYPTRVIGSPRVEVATDLRAIIFPIAGGGFGLIIATFFAALTDLFRRSNV